MELFSQATDPSTQPLAARMRPRHIDEYVGQEHIIGPGRLLRRAIQADQLSSLIFYGPPGTGKTTLAQVIANTTKSEFTTLNAVLSGVKQLREVIAAARERRDLYDRRTILFIDEVHRWNKSQQDALLPWVENGTVILIGATTENPFFEVNKALVSRSRIFQLKPLTDDHLGRIARQALADEGRGFGKERVALDEAALQHLVHTAGGDARSLLNALELAVTTTAPAGGSKHITLEIAEQSIQQKAVLYDKEGDYHYDVISAFIKSIRGSDPDATLYWLARMLQAGESPRFIFRRMLIAACEDIGLADPQAIVVVEADAAALDRIGLPEGRFHLAHAALYLATAPKSNSCMAIFDALATVQKEQQGEVPLHLRDASRDGEAMGHQAEYLYPHAYRDHWVAQQYLPGALQGKTFYTPAATGYEATLKTEVEKRRELQLAAATEAEPVEILSFTPPDKRVEAWLGRLSAEKNQRLAAERTHILQRLTFRRHDRVLDLQAGSGLLCWEALRRVPEGGVWARETQDGALQLLQHHSSRLAELNRPVLVPAELGALLTHPREYLEEELRFDIILWRNLLTRLPDKAGLLRQICLLLAPQGQLAFAEIVPAASTRLTELLTEELAPQQLAPLKQAEERLHSDPQNALLNWQADDLERWCREAGLQETHLTSLPLSEERRLQAKDLQRWLEKPAGASGGDNLASLLKHALPGKQVAALTREVIRRLDGRVVRWERQVAVCSGHL